MGRFQGVDARLEEVNQISKDSEEAILDEAAWLRDFRMMRPKITLEKKLLRDQGADQSDDDSSSLHTRSNYKEIVILEAKLRQSGWLENPLQYKEPTTVDGTIKLSEESINFWSLATKNERCGIIQLICGKKVSFSDVDIEDASVADTEDSLDFEGLKAKVTLLINKLPKDSHNKTLYLDYNKTVIENLTNTSENVNLLE